MYSCDVVFANSTFTILLLLVDREISEDWPLGHTYIVKPASLFWQCFSFIVHSNEVELLKYCT